MDSNVFYYPKRMKIVTGSVMAAIDRVSIHERGIAGATLMQNAGEATANELFHSMPEFLQNPLVWCGKGNNGGDGYVIANVLAKNGCHPTIVLLCSPNELQGDALYHFQRAHCAGINTVICKSESDIISTIQQSKASMHIDALLGTGAKGAPRGLIETAIIEINKQFGSKPIVAVDISSGVNADTGGVEGIALMADVVYTMGLPKVGHVLPPGLDYYKELKVLDIGFPVDLLDSAEAEAEWLTCHLINSWLPKRGISSHKGSEGHLLVIAGSRNMPGAAMMCVKSAVLSGSGLVTLACPESIHVIMTQQVWEKMTLPVSETNEGTFSIEAYNQIFQGNVPYTAIVIGPGLSRNESTMAFVRQVFEKIDLPILIDGDGLFALSLDDLKKKESAWVITPHPGEMARLFQTTSKVIQSNRWKYANDAVNGSSGVCVLKGPKTVISRKGDMLYINPTGNPAMASGGMGDILAGLTGGLMARGMEPLKAACSGAYIHGLAADVLVNETRAECICATDVALNIQKAVQIIRKEAGGWAA